jgi:hypothetical protein
MPTCRALALSVAAALLGGVVQAQKPVELSGTWVLVSAPGMGEQTGTGRGGRSSGGGVVTSEVSGAAFNCGTECTIVQTAASLTVSRPPDRKGVNRPDTVIPIDGRLARWEGSTLVVTRPIVSYVEVTQRLTVEARRMKVVSSFNVPDDVPLTLIYEKRP